MIRWFSLLSVLLWGQVALAQPIPVQTGEHADFTRVVLTIPTGATWRVGRIDAGYGIQVDGAEGFDLDGFFDIIPRTRISAADLEDETLALRIACDCRAAPFLDRPGILVVDIQDGSPDPEATAEIALFPAPEPDPAPIVTAAESVPLDLDLITLPPVSANLLGPMVFPPAEELLERADAQNDLNTLETQIAQSLSRAASQGLLDLREDLRIEPETPDQTTAATLPEPTPAIETAALAVPGISARSSVDSALAGVLDGRAVTAELMSCWPDAHVDVAGWGSDDDFAMQMSAARSAVTGEFDRVDPVAVLSLARLHVHFGFGREAIQTFEIDGEMSRERAAVVTLAQIIDGDPLSDSSILAQVNCPSDVALWAALALPTDATLEAVEPREIALQFRRLPDPLQQHLRPRLALRFLDLDETDLAETVMSSGPVGAPSVETAMVLSEIATERGDSDRAADTLNTLSETDARLTPEAVIRLVDLQIAEGNPISPNTLSAAQTLEFENRDAPIAAELSRIIVAAHLHNTQRSLAWQALQEFRDVLHVDERDRLEDAIAAATTTDGSDAEFIELVFNQTLEAVLPPTENDMAQRLISLGFPEQSLETMRHPAHGGVMAERRYLRAEAAVLMGDFAQAEAHLAGISTPRATQILSFGPDGVALLPLTGPAEAENASDTTTAWRNGDWSTLDAGEDELLSRVGGMVLSTPPLALDEEAPLAAGRALVADANETRTTIEALFDRFDAPLLEDDPS